jgi:enamine deaminase RidA (YjgF/YER057c/UK114 family)
MNGQHFFAMSVDARLSSLGVKLIKNSTPIGNFTYVPTRRSGNLVYVSGQLPRVERDGKLELIVGKVGSDVDFHNASAAARLCGISILSVLADAIENLDKVKAVVKVDGFVNAVESFTDHPLVIDGCSDLFVDVFGSEIGSHARAAVGCSSLPKGVPVEVAAIFEVSD